MWTTGCGLPVRIFSLPPPLPLLSVPFRTLWAAAMWPLSEASPSSSAKLFVAPHRGWTCSLVSAYHRRRRKPLPFSNSTERLMYGIFPAGMAITGLGTGINELTALAGTAELVPLSRRGYYIAGMTLTILPFLPSAMFAQLISFHSTWRFIAVLTSVWAFVGLVLTVLFYSPPPRADQQDRGNKIHLLKRIDLVGGVLSVAGVASVEVGLLGGGYQVSLVVLGCFGLVIGFERLTSSAFMDECAYPCAAGVWRLLHCWVCGMGTLRHTKSNGPSTSQQGSPDPTSHHAHHFHLRGQLLLCAVALARPSLQCLWT